MTEDYDILLMSDFGRPGDLGLRVKRELEAFHRIGYHTGVLHMPFGKTRVVSPDVQAAIRSGFATPVSAKAAINTKLAIVHSPGHARFPLPDLSRITAEKVLLVQDRPAKIEQMGLWQGFSLGEVHWAPVNRWVRKSLENLGMPVPIEQEDWRSIAGAAPRFKRYAAARRPAFVGRISTNEADQWIGDPDLLRLSHTLPKAMQGLALGVPAKGESKEILEDLHWTFFETHKMSADRLIGMLDVMLYMPGNVPRELPEAALSTALASGKPLILPDFLRNHIGPGAVYCDPEEVPAALEEIADLLGNLPPAHIDEEEFSDPLAALDDLRSIAVDQADVYFSAAPRLAQVAALTADAQPANETLRAPVNKDRRTQVLLVASNGIGLGHLTRLLAIARRLGKEIEPVFATLASAVSVVESFGFTAEYIPSYAMVDTDMQKWDAWFELDIKALLDRYDPAMVVFDGNQLSPGLVNAVMTHGASSLCWVRRGMYGTAKAPHIENSRFCELILEPGELATEADSGITARRRNEVLMTAPVTLLDRNELLTREEARLELGLERDKPAALVHLGAGANRNLPDLTAQVIQHLRALPDTQIVLTEWATGAYAFPPFRDVKLITGVPIARYFNAFDFSVGSAGYNSFHEVVGFGLPTVFIANRDPSMDDQGARARFAQDYTAGFDLEEPDLGLLPTVLQAMASPKVQAALREGCAELSTPNGAVAAATAIREMVLS